jgi:hypothetical protein|tara:strand:- start:332 stop:592 length:261 start_codon:yes stop_codon:yes gene_type:complete
MINPTFYVYEVLCSYGDMTIMGPYTSLELAARFTTDGRERGIDGDKTVYTFVKIEDNVQKIIGEVTFEDLWRWGQRDGERRTESWK